MRLSEMPSEKVLVYWIN